MNTADSLPYTLTSAIMYRKRLESFGELPKEKRPPRYMWDRPYELSQYLEHVWDTNKEENNTKMFYEYNLDEVE